MGVSLKKLVVSRLGLFGMAFVSSAVIAGCDTGLAYIIKPLIDTTFHLPNVVNVAAAKIGAGVTNPGRGIANKAQEAEYLVGLILLCIVLRGVFATVLSGFVGRVRGEITSELRERLFAHLLKMPKSFFAVYSRGELVTKISYNIDQVVDVIVDMGIDGIRNLLTIIFLAAAIFHLAWQVLAMFLATVPLVIVIQWLGARAVKKHSALFQGSVARAGDLCEQAATLHMQLKIYNIAKLFLGQLACTDVSLKYSMIRSEVYGAITTGLVQVFTVIPLLAVIYLNSLGMLQLSPGTFVALIVLLGRLYIPLRILSRTHISIQPAQTSLADLNVILHVKGERNGYDELVASQGLNFKFDKVAVDVGGGNLVLQDISCDFAVGETVALVGASGSGKSTFLQVMANFYQPCAGSITVNGQNMATVTNTSLRDRLAYVEQDVCLLPGTLLTNIVFSEENYDQERLELAIKVANLAGWVDSLPHGLATVLDPHSANISGGQKQRIAIARAVYKQVDLLLLDEITAALDSHNAQGILTDLVNIKDVTKIMVTHRRDELRFADRIMVLENGRLIANDTYANLQANAAVWENWGVGDAPHDVQDS